MVFCMELFREPFTAAFYSGNIYALPLLPLHKASWDPQGCFGALEGARGVRGYINPEKVREGILVFGDCSFCCHLRKCL